jgi:hypothetical protein
MKRARILTYVQAGIVTLCYVALIAAVVVKFTGGRTSHAIALSLLGSALGFGSTIVGRFVKRAHEANPMAQLGNLLLQCLPSDSVQSPPPPVAVTIRPIPGKDRRYAITIHNGSLDILSNGSLDHGALLHPGKFGLDDTHMPRDIWVQPPVHFKSLAPGADATWEVDGYDVAPKYDGPKNTRVTVNASRVRNEGALASSENLTASVRMAW